MATSAIISQEGGSAAPHVRNSITKSKYEHGRKNTNQNLKGESMKSFEKIKGIIAGMEPEVAKVDKGNKSAGVRVRAQLMEIRNLCIEAKKESLGKQ